MLLSLHLQDLSVYRPMSHTFFTEVINCHTTVP